MATTFPLERSFSEHLRRQALALDAFEAWDGHVALLHLPLAQRADLFVARNPDSAQGISAAALVELTLSQHQA